MILVEKKVLSAEKSYQNMATKQNPNSRGRVQYLKKKFLQSRYKGFFGLSLLASDFIQKSLFNVFNQNKSDLIYLASFRRYKNSFNFTKSFRQSLDINTTILGFYFKYKKKLMTYLPPSIFKSYIFRCNNFEFFFTSLIKELSRCLKKYKHKPMKYFQALLKKFGYFVRNNFIFKKRKFRFKLGFKFWGLLKIFYKLRFFKRYLFEVINKLQRFNKIIFRLKNLKAIKYYSHIRNSFGQAKKLVPFNSKLTSYLTNLISSSHNKFFNLLLPSLFSYIKGQRSSPNFYRFLAKYSHFVKLTDQLKYKNEIIDFGFGLKILKPYTKRWNMRLLSQLRKIKIKSNSKIITRRINQQLRTLICSKDNLFYRDKVKPTKLIRLSFNKAPVGDKNSLNRIFKFSYLSKNFRFGQYSLLIKNSYLEGISLADVRSLRFQRDVNYVNF